MTRVKVEDIHSDLFKCETKCSVRGLRKGAAWAAELAFDLRNGYLRTHLNIDTRSVYSGNNQSLIKEMDAEEYDCYRYAMRCFELSEYDRSAFISQSHQNNPMLKFVHFYSRYLATEKRRLDSMVDATVTIDSKSSRAFCEIRNDLERDLRDCDSWLLYVYAIVLLKLDDRQLALTKLVQSITAEPLNWPSWQQLAVIIDKSQFEQVKVRLPSHWMRQFFEGIVYLELDMNEQAHDIYSGNQNPITQYFQNSNYVKTQIATVRHNLRDVDAAVEIFGQIRTSDPFRLHKMDIYSNLLYIKGMRNELASLSHAMNNIDPFRVETCCCIANFYSIRSDHSKSVVYFSRALQLNPAHVSALILMGHEYVELKNTNEAIRAYRAAVNINKRDYRAWYGLGQTYEILAMPNYCLEFYTRAQNLRPYDTRMIMALGDTYEHLNRYPEAMKCYERAGGTGLFKWATLLEKKGHKEEACEVYKKFIKWWNETNINQSIDTEIKHALKYLEN